MPLKKSRTIAFDFDGVIAQYNGFVHDEHICDPVPAVVDTIRILKKKGHKILIHSTRGEAFLKKYCKQFSIPFDYINTRPDKQGKNPGKPIAFLYIDDRAICYKGQSASKLVKEIENFQSYWE